MADLKQIKLKTGIVKSAHPFAPSRAVFPPFPLRVAGSFQQFRCRALKDIAGYQKEVTPLRQPQTLLLSGSGIVASAVSCCVSTLPPHCVGTEEARLAKMQAATPHEPALRQQRGCLEEAQAMVPDSRRRTQQALEDLAKLLVLLPPSPCAMPFLYVFCSDGEGYDCAPAGPNSSWSMVESDEDKEHEDVVAAQAQVEAAKE
eukprot:gene2858-3453_t